MISSRERRHRGRLLTPASTRSRARRPDREQRPISLQSGARSVSAIASATPSTGGDAA